MPVTAADIRYYCSASMPENDTGVSGGAIDLLTVAILAAMAATDDVEAVSTAAGDTTQVLTITGRNAAGSIVTDSITLTGTTPVQDATSPNQFERILKIEMSATAVGTVTIRRAPAAGDIVALVPGVRNARRLFYDSTSEVLATKDMYEKIFVKNTHATLNLIASGGVNPTVDLTVEPAASSDFRMALANVTNDTASVTNRVTAPAAGVLEGSGFQQPSNPITIPGLDLAAGEAIGVWFHLALAIDNAEFKDDIQIAVAGKSS